jgi:hypothetical protein
MNCRSSPLRLSLLITAETVLEHLRFLQADNPHILWTIAPLLVAVIEEASFTSK